MADLLAAQANPEYAANQGARWTFAAILPESGFVHTVHTAERTSQQAEVFINKIKAKSDGQAPSVTSDSGPPVRLVLRVGFSSRL